MTASIYQHFSETELQILKARAERAARTPQSETQGKLLTILAIQVSNEHYALPIDSISSVYEGLNITRVPCVSPSVAGIANIRGRIVLVLNLKTLLNIAGAPATTSVLVALNEDLDLALLVDRTSDVESFPISEMSPIPANIDLQKSGCIRGLFGSKLALLDLRAVLNQLSADSAIFVA